MNVNKNHVTPSEPAWRRLKMPLMGWLVVGARWYFDRGYEARSAELSEPERALAEIDRILGLLLPCNASVGDALGVLAHIEHLRHQQRTRLQSDL